MGKVQRFERRLQGVIGDVFARVFGGSVVPQEVAQGLQREAEDNARPLAGGRVLAPNRYTVTLGAADHDRLAGDEQRVIRLLQDCVRQHIDEQAWDTYGDVVVTLERSETLHTGQFRTSSTVDPDASRRAVAQPRNAGDGAMSQQPGQYPEDERRGQHDQYGGYGYEQGQAGGYSADQYGQQYGYEPSYGQPPQPPGQGYNQNYGQNYADPGNAGSRYDQNYGYDANYAQGRPAPEQYGQQYGYDQGAGYDQGYGQGGYGYDASYGQGQQAPGQGYDQNYGQYGGAHPGYGYEAGPGYQNYGAGYPADPGVQGYAPPAVQTGPRQLAASLTLDDGSNRSYQLAEGSNVVGRGQDAQFRLPDTGVSRRHLEIIWDGQVAMLADLGSTNGTTVNGTPVQTWQLADGDVVRVGHSSLVFRTQG